MTSFSLASCQSTKTIFTREVRSRFEQPAQPTRTITEADLNQLPHPVAMYLRSCGWVGRKIPKNFYLTFDGEFSLKEGKYTKIKSEQYNWFDQPTRIFHITTALFGGRHRYDERGAYMLIKLFKRIKLVNAHGAIMDQSELVTYLNDLCIFAPGALVEAPITWETIDDLSVKATISQYGQTISATLYFNENHELVNFISHDRYASSDGKKNELLPWSTPIKNYREVNGIKLPSYGEAVWHYPDREWVYAKFNIKEVQWSVKQPRITR